ncbi:amidohydrolase [Kribbella sp.]|uniref:amidohydrolase n=1 Tax=Kribbella sp. TaxID=1871183 RepID=UPI002D69330B|nr:amidohydrolase [Kribbella sp.]HZX01892.1 amidohydrolase [Kribbella sp.]
MTMLAIRGATVVPIDGPPIPGGTVLIDARRIVAVGAAVDVPEGATVVDARGRWVLPGLVDAHTHMGTLEEGEGWAGDDHDEATTPVTAQLRALDAINPADEGFRDAVGGGVLAVGINPGSCNPIAGETVAVRCTGRTVDEMVLRSPAGMKSALGENPKRYHGDAGRLPATRMGIAAVIRQALAEARQYDGTPVDLGKEALGRVLRREIPWRQHCHRADDIRTAVRLADEFGYDLVIDHGTEAHLVAELLAERNIPVLLGPLIVGRGKVELRNRAFRNARLLAEAGIELSLVTDHPVIPANLLIVQAAYAVREGLDRDVALRAVTLNPARALGIADRLGSLAPGKDADLCVWSGDPLDPMQRVELAYQQGREVFRWNNERRVGTINGRDWWA